MRLTQCIGEQRIRPHARRISTRDEHQRTLLVDPEHRQAIALLDDAATIIGSRQPRHDWPWPEARLTYANAVLPDALMAIGAARNRPDLVEASDAPDAKVGS